MKRNANFELMKICSMLMIVMWHILIHGRVVSYSLGHINEFFEFVLMAIAVHVNSFVLVTGYYQYKKNIKLSKLVSLNNAMWFYKIAIFIIFTCFGFYAFSSVDKLQIFLPINYNYYWFLLMYSILYLCIPLLNKVIENINQSQHQRLLIVMLLILCVLSTFTNQVAYNNANGYSLGQFIMLYFLGAYIAKYDFKFLKKLSNCRLRIICLLICLVLPLINVFIFIFLRDIPNKSPMLTYWYDLYCYGRNSYCNPLIIIQTLSYFYFFKSLKINNKILSKIINAISGTTFGVYLIHDNPFMRTYMYTHFLGFLEVGSYSSKRIILKVAFMTLVVFGICSILEFIRKLMFKLLYNLNINKNLRSKIVKYCKQKDIPW